MLPRAGGGRRIVTFVGSGGSLENVAGHDGGGAVNHALVLIVYWRARSKEEAGVGSGDDDDDDDGDSVGGGEVD